jgi:hypothetical protein
MKRFLSAMLLAVIATTGIAQAQDARVIVGLGNQMSVNSVEVSARYLAAEPLFWNIHPAFGVSLAENGSGWVGAGWGYTLGTKPESAFLRVTNMVGAHRRGSGRDLGSVLQFRTALDVGYRWRSGVEAGLGIDHRSNAGLGNLNPGLNTAYLFASFPFN